MAVRTCMALAFLPVDEVTTVYYWLKPQLVAENNRIRRYLRYYEGQWIEYLKQLKLQLLQSRIRFHQAWYERS